MGEDTEAGVAGGAEIGVGGTDDVSIDDEVEMEI